MPVLPAYRPPLLALRTLGLTAATTACLAFVAPAAAQTAAVTTLSIGTGSVTGVYYAAGAAICRLVLRQRPEQRIRCSAEPTGGSVFNVSSLKSGELEFGIVQSDVAYNAYNGERQFQEAGAYKKLRVVFSLHAEPVTIVASKGAHASSFDDLRGKRFNVGSVGSSSRNLIEQYLAARGEDLQFFGQVTTFKPDEHGAALCSGKIDGFVYGIGHPSANIQDPTSSCGALLIPLTGPAVDKLVAGHVYYRKTVIPGGLYPNNPKPTPTYGVTATLVASADVPEDVVYLLTQAVFDNLDDFKRLHPAFDTLKATDMSRNPLPVPMHAGAKRYFSEQSRR